MILLHHLVVVCRLFVFHLRMSESQAQQRGVLATSQALKGLLDGIPDVSDDQKIWVVDLIPSKCP